MDVLQSYGLAGLVITTLAGVVIFLYRKNDALQEQRLQDAIQVRDKIIEPLSKVADTTEKIYAALLGKRRG